MHQVWTCRCVTLGSSLADCRLKICSPSQSEKYLLDALCPRITHPSTVRCEVFTATEIQVLVFWVVIPCIDMVGYQHFREPGCLAEDGGNPSIWNFGILPHYYAVSQPRRLWLPGMWHLSFLTLLGTLLNSVQHPGNHIPVQSWHEPGDLKFKQNTLELDLETCDMFSNTQENDMPAQ
jgi:hypothetical protein